MTALLGRFVARGASRGIAMLGARTGGRRPPTLPSIALSSSRPVAGRATTVNAAWPATVRTPPATLLRPSRAAAWREADAMERSGMTPQQVSRAFRERLGASAAAVDAMAEAEQLLRDGGSLEDARAVLVNSAADADGSSSLSLTPPPTKEKPVSTEERPLRRGFLLNADDDDSAARRLPTTTTTTTEAPPPTPEAPTAEVEALRARSARLVATSLGLEHDPSAADAAFRSAVLAYAAAATTTGVGDLGKALDYGVAVARRVSVEKAAPGDDDVRRVTAFVDAVRRAAVARPYEDGPRLKPEDVLFMATVHELRSTGVETDQTLRQRVLTHVATHGPAFFDHMASCAALIDALLALPDVDKGDLRRHLLAHYT
mmetsp:Transcript_4276/g.17348  ORF Transcript_4276/g.17348 Transcript_4276/m.17348 type:complete len:373 (-) Transcript_4276:103-1221(-)